MKLLSLNLVVSMFLTLINPNAVQPVQKVSAVSETQHTIQNADLSQKGTVPGWTIEAQNYGVGLQQSSMIQGLALQSEGGFTISTALPSTKEVLDVNLEWYVVGNEETTITVSTNNGDIKVDSEDIVVEAGKLLTSTIRLSGLGANKLVIQSESNVEVHIQSVSVEGIELTNSNFNQSMTIPGWISSGSLVSTTYRNNQQVIYLNDTSTTLQVLVKTTQIPITSEARNYIFKYNLNVLKQTHSVEIGVRFYDDKGKQLAYQNSLLKGLAAQGDTTSQIVVEGMKGATSFELVVSSGGVSNTELFVNSLEATSVPVEKTEELIHDVLNNADFEASKTELLGWTKATAGGVVSLGKDVVLNGESSLYFYDNVTEGDMNVSAPRVISDKFKATPGDDLTVSANVYALQQTHNIVLEVYFYDANDKQLSMKQELFSSNSLGVKKWSKMNVVTRVPDGADTMAIAFYSGVPSITEAYFDDVSVTVMPKDIPLDRNYQKPVEVGPMVDVSLGQASVIAYNTNGELEIYFHSNGAPGTFSVLDGVTGELKFSQKAPTTEAVWGMVRGKNGKVYFASTGDGSLFEYDPIAKSMKVVGVNPVDKWTWDLEVAEDGKIYGSTYPNAGVWEFDPSTGKFKDYGRIVDDSQYVRGIAVEGDYIYAGTGTTRHLMKINRHTGEKTELVIEGHTGTNGYFENVILYEDYMFVSRGSVEMLVVDRETLEVVDSFHYNNNLSQPDPNNPNIIYYKSNQKFFKYDMSKLQKEEIQLEVLLPDTTRVKDFFWTQNELAFITAYGEMMFYNPKTESLRFLTLDISAQPVAIQSLEAGFDGRLYMGGYQRGMSIYNPFTGKKDLNISSFAQPEGIGFLNGKAYFGTYVSAIMYVLDPSLEVSLGDNPSMLYSIGDQQDRPFAITSGDDKLFVGTVPDYGVLGGVLAIYDETTGTWFKERNVVKDQSIISLAYHEGLLFGGTSVWGGLDSTPTQTEAKLFIWDTKTNTKVKEISLKIPTIDETPKMIGELSVGPDGYLWGIVDGTVFAFDMDTEEVVKSKLIQPSKYNSSKWFPYRIEWGPDGMMYTTLSRQLIAIDPLTLQHKVLVSDFINNMTMTLDGTIYYAIEDELYAIHIPETDATLSSISINGNTIESFSPGILDYVVEVENVESMGYEATQENTTVQFNQNGDIYTFSVIAQDGVSTLTYSVKVVQKVDDGEIVIDSDVVKNPELSYDEGSFIDKVVSFIISTAKSSSDQLSKILDQIRSTLATQGKQIKHVFTFSMEPLDKDGNKVQVVDGKSVKVSFDLPTYFENLENLYVYHINADGSLSTLTYRVEGTHITIDVEAFSDFVIVEVQTIESQEPTDKVEIPEETLPETGIANHNFGISFIVLGIALLGVFNKKKHEA